MIDISCPNELYHGVMRNVIYPELKIPAGFGFAILKIVKVCGMCGLRLEFEFPVSVSYDNQ